MWLKGESTLSGDELAAFVPEPCPAVVGFRYQSLTTPVHDASGNLMLLQGKLFQFGSKEIRITKKLNQTQSTEDVKIVAITMWKSDYEASAWKQIIQQPVRQCKTMLQQQDTNMTLLQPWGRRYRDSKGETTPESCESIQFHCLVPSACFATMVKRSGWNKIYVTPKSQDGKLIETYKVIWCTQPVQELQTKVAVMPACQGLVRGKRSHGVRVDATCFAEMWELLKPSQPVPDITHMTKTFRLEPLPYGVNREALQEWSAKHSWPIKALRSIGGQQWLVGSNVEPPSKVLQFNGTPVLIKPVADKPPRRNGPVLAGKEVLPKLQAKTPQELDEDPWMLYRENQALKPQSQMPVGPSSSSAVPGATHKGERSVAGPIAQQFDQQSARITNLEQQLGKLVEAQTQHASQVDARFEKMNCAFRTHAEQTQNAVNSVQTELQRTIAAAMQKQDQQLFSQMQDLKKFFSRGIKRKDAESGDEEVVPPSDEDDM
eukprot:Skav208496  [mRNA]  locus=scaffold87:211967:213430:- [translate_table: standard]